MLGPPPPKKQPTIVQMFNMVEEESIDVDEVNDDIS